MPQLRWIVLVVIVFLSITSPFRPEPASARSGVRLPGVQINDNRRSAGTREGDSLVLRLRAGRGLWQPEADRGPTLQVEAFGEEDGSLQVPAPLIRVRQGTRVSASIRNGLDSMMRVHGLCARDGTPCEPVEIAPSETRTVQFAATAAGTYHYWATTTGAPLNFRGSLDTQLSGAFIVDPAGAAPPPDRVFVITEWTSLSPDELRRIAGAEDPSETFLTMNPQRTLLMNGLSWPATERLSYGVGEEVRWRIVNLSTQRHPMHLHGFYFAVESVGDGLRETRYDEQNERRVVTELLAPGGTFAMRWRPERPGNWLFHCHISEHVSPERRLGLPGDRPHHHHHHANNDSTGMAGMILGVTISAPQDSTLPGEVPLAPARKLTLVMQTEAGRYGSHPALGFVLADEDGSTPPTVPVPGPTLVLTRGQPVEITLVNRLPDATSIHWHGMELDSYYDGVHGFGGTPSRITPSIEPGQRFVVRFTPPRSGTFMYHTHMHDHQLASGMYGAMLVTEPGETFDAERDHVIVIGRGGPGRHQPVLINGDPRPKVSWKAGVRHRIRFVNITPDDIFVVSLAKVDTPVEWLPIAKDAAPLRGVPKPAVETMAAGETFDFGYDARPGRGLLWINVRTASGYWEAQGRVTLQ
jgi:FtsP/CotA-like multicopper oxidase with cupredoxin domain